MSFTTYTKIVTLLNNIQPRAQKIQLRYTPRTPRNPHHNRTSPPYYPRTLPVSPCECLHSHTGYCRPVNYPVKTKGSKQTSRLPAPTLVLTGASTGYLPGHLPEYLRRYLRGVPTGAGISTPEGTLHPTDSALAQACWRIHSRCERTPTWQRTSSGQKPTSAP